MTNLFINSFFHWLSIASLFSFFCINGYWGKKIFRMENKIDSKNLLSEIFYLNIFGLFFVTFILQLWHLFYSINTFCTIFFLILTIVAIYKLKYFIIDLCKIIYQKISLLSLGSFFIFTIWLANLSNSSLGPYDAGLYHLQFIKWIDSYPIIPGLVNLHHRFGFNSSYFLLLTLADNFFINLSSLWNFNGYILSLGFYYFFSLSIQSLFENYGQNSAKPSVMKLILIIPLIHYCFYYHPSTSTDLPVIIIASIIAVEVFKFIFQDGENGKTILILILLGVVFKISFSIMAAAIFVILFYRMDYWKQLFHSTKQIITLSLFLVFGLIWVVRGIALSGYPFFPHDSFGVPVSWKMDKSEVKKISSAMLNYSIGLRNPDDIINRKKIKNDWIKTRLLVQHRRVETLYPLMLGIFGILYLLIKRKIIFRLILFNFPAIIQMVIWYYLVPINRFGCFAFWWFGAGTGQFLLGKFDKKIGRKLLPALVLLIGFSFHIIDLLGQKKSLFRLNTDNAIPIPLLEDFTTDPGLKLLVPKQGNQCWDSPLPCTPDPSSLLKLRTKGKISEGFVNE